MSKPLRLDEEHEAVRNAQRWIGVELAQYRGGQQSRKHGEVLQGSLESFRRHLRHHFELEEGEGGPLRVAPEQAGNRADKLRGLVAQHREFERRLDEIVALVEGANLAGTPAPDRLDELLGSLTADMGRHEAMETVLFPSS